MVDTPAVLRAALITASVMLVAACAPNGKQTSESTVESTSSVATSVATSVDDLSTVESSAVAETAAALSTVPAVTVVTVPLGPPAATLATVPSVTVVTVPVAGAPTTTSPASSATTTTTTSTTTNSSTTIAAGATTTVQGATTTIAEGEVSSLLLDAGDLPADWEISEPEPYVGTRDTDIADACPSADALNRVDLHLTWRSDYATEDVLSMQQMVGTYPTAADALADVTEIARIGSCDLSSFFADALTTADALDTDVDAPGADAASAFLVDSTPNGAYVEVIAVAVGPIVTLIIVTGTSQLPVVDDFVASAAEKIVALTS